jgi:hypothetical protein
MNDQIPNVNTLMGTRVDRRSMIKRALTLGGAAYVAPMILSTATPVSAQGVTPPPGGSPNPECTGATCATFSQFPCSSNPDCVCTTLAAGGGFCVPGSTSCASLAACGAGNTCPAGSLCVVNTCCAGAVCVPTSLTCPPSTTPPPNFDRAASWPAGSIGRR